MKIGIIGQTCSGKSTVLKRLNFLDYPIAPIVSDRPMRKGEINSIDCKFISKTEFKEKLQEENIICHSEILVSDNKIWNYGLDKENLNKLKNFIVIINARQIKEFLEEFPTAKIIYLDTPYTERLKRSNKRKDDITERDRRFQSDLEDFEKIEKYCDIIISKENGNKMILELLKEIGNIQKEKQTMEVTFPIPPSVNSYLTRNPAGGVTTSQDAIFFQNQLMSKLLKKKKEINWQTPLPHRVVGYDVIYYFPRKGMDPNNHFKVPIDIFVNSGIIKDDDMVRDRTIDFFIDSENPETKVRVYETDKLGIFKDQKGFLDFIEKNNCLNCSRSNRNCSVLRNALDNRVSQSINENMECEEKKFKL